MFTNKKLETTINRKIADILNKEGGSDADYIRSLQTLFTLKDAAWKKQTHIEKRNDETD